MTSDQVKFVNGLNKLEDKIADLHDDLRLTMETVTRLRLAQDNEKAAGQARDAKLDAIARQLQEILGKM